MVNTKIEWCDASWNPLTGCHHDCSYCFARRIAERFKGCNDCPDGNIYDDFITLKDKKTVTTKSGKVLTAAYPYGFTPTFHEYRLGDLKKKGFGKNIFVCSMSDLFGTWVPDEVIKKVFDSCIDAPNHRYLFLTKNPRRYMELANSGLLPNEKNFWYGTTVTGPNVMYFYAENFNTFLSIEPILSPITKENGFSEKFADYINWFIFGAETGNRKDKVVPERFWVEDIVSELQKKNKPIFMKDSMKPIWGEDIITQFPWED